MWSDQSFYHLAGKGVDLISSVFCLEQVTADSVNLLLEDGLN